MAGKINTYRAILNIAIFVVLPITVCDAQGADLSSQISPNSTQEGNGTSVASTPTSSSQIIVSTSTVSTAAKQPAPSTVTIGALQPSHNPATISSSSSLATSAIPAVHTESVTFVPSAVTMTSIAPALASTSVPMATTYMTGDTTKSTSAPQQELTTQDEGIAEVVTSSFVTQKQTNGIENETTGTEDGKLIKTSTDTVTTFGALDQVTTMGDVALETSTKGSIASDITSVMTGIIEDTTPSVKDSTTAPKDTTTAEPPITTVVEGEIQSTTGEKVGTTELKATQKPSTQGVDTTIGLTDPANSQLNVSTVATTLVLPAEASTEPITQVGTDASINMSSETSTAESTPIVAVKAGSSTTSLVTTEGTTKAATGSDTSTVAAIEGNTQVGTETSTNVTTETSTKVSSEATTTESPPIVAAKDESSTVSVVTAEGTTRAATAPETSTVAAIEATTQVETETSTNVTTETSTKVSSEATTTESTPIVAAKAESSTVSRVTTDGITNGTTNAKVSETSTLAATEASTQGSTEPTTSTTTASSVATAAESTPIVVVKAESSTVSVVTTEGTTKGTTNAKESETTEASTKEEPTTVKLTTVVLKEPEPTTERPSTERTTSEGSMIERFTTNIIMSSKEGFRTTEKEYLTTTTSALRNESFVIKFDGKCDVLYESSDMKTKFKDSLVNVLKSKLDLFKDKFVWVEEITCGSVIATVKVAKVSNRDNIDEALENLINTNNLTLVIQNENITEKYTAKELQMPPAFMTTTTEAYQTPVSKTLSNVQIILIIVFSVVGGFLLFIILAACIAACHQRHTSKSFTLGHTPKLDGSLEDFSLTKLDRPKPSYQDNGRASDTRVRVLPSPQAGGIPYPHANGQKNNMTSFQNSPLLNNGRSDPHDSDTLPLRSRQHPAQDSDHEVLMPNEEPHVSPPPGYENPSYSSEDMLDSDQEEDAHDEDTPVKTVPSPMYSPTKSDSPKRKTEDATSF